jgi:hypothetical protein
VIQAVGAIGQYSDSEYLRIIQELMKLGISPSGNKYIDKIKLGQAQRQQEQSQFQVSQVQDDSLNTDEQSERANMEISKVGATNLAEINKVLLGLN